MARLSFPRVPRSSTPATSTSSAIQASSELSPMATSRMSKPTGRISNLIGMAPHWRISHPAIPTTGWPTPGAPTARPSGLRSLTIFSTPAALSVRFILSPWRPAPCLPMPWPMAGCGLQIRPPPPTTFPGSSTWPRWKVPRSSCAAMRTTMVPSTSAMGSTSSDTSSWGMIRQPALTRVIQMTAAS